MKKIILLCTLLTTGLTSFAQSDPKARAILDDMSEKIKKCNSYSATVTSSLINKEEGIDEKFESKVIVKREKYRLTLEGQVIINNGDTIWTYIPDVNEVNIDNYDLDEDEISPLKIYDSYKEGYKYVFIGEENKKGVLTSVIDLESNDAEAEFFKIKLYISKGNSDLKGWTTFDKSGNLYTYDISNFKKNLIISDQTFEFDVSKYPGVEVVDLR